MSWPHIQVCTGSHVSTVICACTYMCTRVYITRVHNVCMCTCACVDACIRVLCTFVCMYTCTHHTCMQSTACKVLYLLRSLLPCYPIGQWVRPEAGPCGGVLQRDVGYHVR